MTCEIFVFTEFALTLCLQNFTNPASSWDDPGSRWDDHDLANITTALPITSSVDLDINISTAPKVNFTKF